VTPGRLGTAFLLLGSTSRLLRRRLFCPNWYVRAGCLGHVRPSLYLAREFAQARTLVGDASALRESNPWLRDFFPNAVAPPTLGGGLRARTRLQRLCEAPLRGVLGQHLERFGRRVALARLRAHYRGLSQEVPAEVAKGFEDGVALRFHGYRYEERTLAAYEARRAELVDRLVHDSQVAPLR
jgi:hypothetical protein